MRKMTDPDIINDPFFAQATWCWLKQNPNCIWAVRHQGETDCCYAFPVTTTMYADQFLREGWACLGSPQELLDCLHIYKPPQGVKQDGPLHVTKRGLPNTFRNAFAYVKVYGLYSDEEYAYLGELQVDKVPTFDHAKIFIKDFDKIPSKSENFHDLVIERLAIQSVTGCILSTRSFRHWSDEKGVYQGPTQGEMEEYQENKSAYGYHALTLVA